MFDEQIKNTRLRYNEHQNVAERREELEKFALRNVPRCSLEKLIFFENAVNQLSISLKRIDLLKVNRHMNTQLS